MKASELKTLLNSLPDNTDPEVVCGELWLPERLTHTQLDGELLFLEFDSAPEETQEEDSDTKAKADAMLALFLMGHELTSSEVIEILENPDIEEETG